MVFEVKDGEEAREIVKKDDKAFFHAVTNNAPKFTQDDEEIVEVEE
jgi:hypothetical protein